MTLSILIPTYNRVDSLLKNLNLLADYILKGALKGKIEIIISNNNSKDKTDYAVKKFQKENSQINLRYFLQTVNIGLEKNALFILDKAQGEYVMYLGDDDFIEYEYLVGCIKHLHEHKTTSCIIPSFKAIDINGNHIEGKGRDLNIKSKVYKKGFKNCLENSWRGHQLSGLILIREGLLEKYYSQNVQNIYPFIFFVAYSCLNGNCFHFTQHPVKVTQPGQGKKDWGYGHDGLLNEIFDNYSKLSINAFYKTALQIKHFQKQRWRLWIYRDNGTKEFFKAFWAIMLTSNSTAYFKIVFPFEVFLLKLRSIF
jgi:glycosyltransferase involved in cell wall biosynthesis